MDRVYEKSTATWDESTVLSFLDAFLLPQMEKLGGGENGTKRTALFYDILHAHRTPPVLAWYKKHRVDRFEMDANLTHDLQGVDQFTSNLKADVSDVWCDYMRKQIKEGIFHEGSKSYKCPTKADVIEWTENAWSNIQPSHLVDVAIKCYMLPTTVLYMGAESISIPILKLFRSINLRRLKTFRNMTHLNIGEISPSSSMSYS